jgi:hypothetical protein
MESLGDKQTSKNEQNEQHIFYCNICHYTCFKKFNMNRHKNTLIHIQRTKSEEQNEQNEQNKEKYLCLYCDKKYISRNGLWKHQKKCHNTNKPINETIDKDELIIQLLKQNAELVQVLKNGTHNNNNNNNTNSHNKTFNLQFFLNETCKDAMNIMDFVDSIKLQLSDLENVGNLGYVEGISNIIVKNLNDLDVTERPIHCTDKKREVLYIKDEDKWEKEDGEKKKIRKMIKKVATKNALLLPKFKDAHPDCVKSISPFSDQYNKIIVESMGGPGDNDCEKENKIIKNISKNITIDKGD